MRHAWITDKALASLEVSKVTAIDQSSIYHELFGLFVNFIISGHTKE